MECPACSGDLRWEYHERRGDRLEVADAACASCAASYPVRGGIGLLLPPGPPRDDPWERLDSGPARHLREHPEVERRLMAPPYGELAPADRFFRALVLEERGHFERAREVIAAAFPRLYTPEMLACRGEQFRYVIDRLAEQGKRRDPVVDLASGRCYLVEELARTLDRPIVATDLSPRVLRRDRRSLESVGLYDRVSLLALDARRPPFRTGAIGALTTFAGLENVGQPDDVLRGWRRAVPPGAGLFLAISQLDVGEGRSRAGADGWSQLLGRFTSAGWLAEVRNACRARAEPTPVGVVLEGVGIDAFPKSPTTIEWGVLAAR
jgi:uncharacterized protein YbaR (Trm112 family)